MFSNSKQFAFRVRVRVRVSVSVRVRVRPVFSNPKQVALHKDRY